MRIEALSADQIQQVHEATLGILEDVGVWFEDSPEAAELFQSNGCRVDDGRVRIPRQVLAECLARLPDRNGLNPPPYTYSLDPAEKVSALVTAGAGAGKGPFSE